MAKPLAKYGFNYLKMQINQLIDLNQYKTAPILDFNQSQKLSKELDLRIVNSDWLTIGIMAKSDIEAKNTLRTMILFRIMNQDLIEEH